MALTMGCTLDIGALSEECDLISFSAAGGTLFSNPDEVTMKEIHLDGSLFIGKDIVIEGNVVEWGKYDTFVVLNDDTARMLVVLTDVPEVRNNLHAPGKLKRFKIWGSVGSGKRGLPFVQAKAVRQIPQGEDMLAKEKA